MHTNQTAFGASQKRFFLSPHAISVFKFTAHSLGDIPLIFPDYLKKVWNYL